MKIGFIIQSDFLLNVGLIQVIDELKQKHEIEFVAHKDQESRYSFSMRMNLLRNFPLDILIYGGVMFHLFLRSIVKRKTLSLKKYCLKKHIQYEKIDKVEKLIKNVDVLICLTNRYLPENIIYSAKYGAINIHPGLLPESKGAMPYIWSVINHVPTGISTHIMSEKYDEGLLLVKRKLSLKRHSLVTYACCIFILMPKVIRLSVQRAMQKTLSQPASSSFPCHANPKCQDLIQFKKNKGKLAFLSDIIFCKNIF